MLSTPARRRRAAPSRPRPVVAPLLPHERDQIVEPTAGATDPRIELARQDVAAGRVDTDMRATPGLDAPERDAIVPGGKELRGAARGKR